MRQKNKLALRRVYYDLSHPSGFGGIKGLEKFVRGKNRTAKAENWLREQPSHFLHHPVRRKFKKQKITSVKGLHQQWEADILFIPGRGGGQSLLPVLTIIDVYSRRGEAQLLPNKSPEAVRDAFERILKTSEYLGVFSSIALRHPHSLRTDAGM